MPGQLALAGYREYHPPDCSHSKPCSSISTCASYSGAASELVVFVLEQNVERGERAVTARYILLQIELVRIAQFVARVHLLLEDSQIIPNHDDFVEECLERHFFWLKRAVSRLHDQRTALPSIRETFHDHVFLFEPERFNDGLRCVTDQIRKRHLQLA
jgi:hypothetical protein